MKTVTTYITLNNTKTVKTAEIKKIYGAMTNTESFSTEELTQYQSALTAVYSVVEATNPKFSYIVSIKRKEFESYFKGFETNTNKGANKELVLELFDACRLAGYNTCSIENSDIVLTHDSGSTITITNKEIAVETVSTTPEPEQPQQEETQMQEVETPTVQEPIVLKRIGHLKEHIIQGIRSELILMGANRKTHLVLEDWSQYPTLKTVTSKLGKGKYVRITRKRQGEADMKLPLAAFIVMGAEAEFEGNPIANMEVCGTVTGGTLKLAGDCFVIEVLKDKPRFEMPITSGSAIPENLMKHNKKFEVKLPPKPMTQTQETGDSSAELVVTNEPVVAPAMESYDANPAQPAPQQTPEQGTSWAIIAEISHLVSNLQTQNWEQVEVSASILTEYLESLDEACFDLEALPYANTGYLISIVNKGFTEKDIPSIYQAVKYFIV